MSRDQEAVDAITPAAQDFIKAVWAATEWGGPPITTSRLATRLGSSAANVSETARRLAGQGLITYRPYRPVTLTERGERLAVAMVRRHRLAETLLVEVLGYTWDEVHDDAERLEHALSPRLVERIAAHLGHPEFDPHGDPIPSVDGVARAPLGRPLRDAPAGRYAIVQVDDGDPGLLAHLRALGLVPGEEVEIGEAIGVVMARGADIVLPEGAAEAIRVRPGGH